MTNKDAVALVGMLFAAYPRFEAPKATIQLYQQFLTDLDVNIAKAAIVKHITTSKYFPTIAEVRDAVISLTNTVPCAADAWSEALKQISVVGTSGIPKFSHQAVQKAVKAIGWRNICMSEEIGVERAHFLKIYESYRSTEIENLKVLPVFKGLGIEPQSLLALPGK